MTPGQLRDAVVRRRALIGSIVWMSTVQYFLIQLVVASAWVDPPYDWRRNAISDLGAVHCGGFHGRAVCSPLHGLMNGSFVVLGITMLVGAALLAAEFRRGRVGFLLMGAGGLGAVLVGLFPEDTVYPAHLLGADLAFLLGNAAIIVVGLVLPGPRWFRIYSVASGVVALLALVVYLSGTRPLLGLGGWERVVAYPQTVWLIVFGIRLARPRTRAALAAASSTVAG